MFEGIKAVWQIRRERKLFKLTDRVIIQGNKVEIMYTFQQNINMNENSTIINVKSYVLLTLLASLLCMKIVSINILKKAKTRTKELGNARIKAVCTILFL